MEVKKGAWLIIALLNFAELQINFLILDDKTLFIFFLLKLF